MISDINPDCFAGLLFVLDVEMGGGVVSHENRREPGLDAAPGEEGCRFLGDLIPNALRKSLAINQLSCHMHPRNDLSPPL